MSKAKRKVLVVDDEALIRMNTSDMLDELGFVVLEASNADEAFTLLARHPDIGLMITDLELPGMGGEELVRTTLALHPQVRVIVATGHAIDRFAGDAAFAGVAFLAKPFDAADLRRALETAARHEQMT